MWTEVRRFRVSNKDKCFACDKLLIKGETVYYNDGNMYIALCVGCGQERLDKEESYLWHLKRQLRDIRIKKKIIK